MDIKSFFTHWIVRNVIGAIVAIAVFVLAAHVILNLATHHGQEIEVPDFSHMSVAQAEQVAKDAKIRIEVTDSVFVRKMGRGLVFSQVPKAGSKVKEGRRIMLTINAVAAKKVSMPDLVGYSMRQAKAELLSKGLLLGRLIYEEDMATNNVLRQLYRGHNIDEGRKIETGSEIDLVVGLGSDDQTYVPDLIGMKYMRAVDAVHDNSLNVARLRFDQSVKTYSDSLDAVVYKQEPMPSDISTTMGSGVTLYLSNKQKNK